MKGRIKKSGIFFDSYPKENSGNAVTSDGIYKALQNGGGGSYDDTELRQKIATNKNAIESLETAMSGKPNKDETISFVNTVIWFDADFADFVESFRKIYNGDNRAVTFWEFVNTSLGLGGIAFVNSMSESYDNNFSIVLVGVNKSDIYKGIIPNTILTLDIDSTDWESFANNIALEKIGGGGNTLATETITASFIKGQTSLQLDNINGNDYRYTKGWVLKSARITDTTGKSVLASVSTNTLYLNLITPGINEFATDGVVGNSYNRRVELIFEKVS